MFRRRGFTLIELLVVIAIIAILAAILFPVFARARAKAQQNNCLSNVKELTLSTLMYCSDYDDYYPIAYYAGNGLYQEWAGEIYQYVRNTQIYACPAGSTLPTYNPAAYYGGPPNGPAPNVYGDYMENTCMGGDGPNGPGCNVSQWPSLKQAAVLRPAEIVLVKAMQSPGWFYNGNPDTAAPYLTAGQDPTQNASYNPSWRSPGTENSHQGGGNVGYCDGHARWVQASVLFASDANDLRMWNNVP